jgi:hypothetical protein
MADSKTNIIITAQDRASEILTRISAQAQGISNAFSGFKTAMYCNSCGNVP